VQITIQKVWPLTPGKANGGFVGTDGKNYKCEAATLGVLHEGMTLDVNVKPSEWQGKTFYWLPRGYMPPSNGAAPPPTTAPAVPTTSGRIAVPPASNGYVPEQEKQGYIMVSVMMKLLADAQTQAGKPVDTQDLPLLADAAVAVWNKNLKGRV
jgi:hypothetical protein